MFPRPSLSFRINLIFFLAFTAFRSFLFHNGSSGSKLPSVLVAAGTPELFSPHSHDSPSLRSRHRRGEASPDHEFLVNATHLLQPRDGLCSHANPCAQGCCSSAGYCGYTDDHCRVDRGCQDTCDAKPPATECGRDASPSGKLCAQGCCSSAGYCGYTDDHCKVDRGCQSTCDAKPLPAQCGSQAGGKQCDDGCCSAAGYCGFGPDYCQAGCQSKCSSAAQCGRYASPAGKPCRMNVCCSTAGYCGFTSAYCDAAQGCQSNCLEHPAVPAGRSNVDIRNHRVIGYYEAWTATRSCRQVHVWDLPLNLYTHLNFAFAYINPATFDIVAMDPSTPVSLFEEFTVAKNINPSIKLMLAIGGWTFFDAGTATRPVLGNIARTAENRQKFADNVVNFCRVYGYDGLDLDWEYPATPDRGGNFDETLNMVELMKTLRQTFDSSGMKLELSFTIPASFYYLRWFEMPELVKYADWTNLMSYDMHGEWDQENAIGKTINPHTNLTEIGQALELLWRVGIPPEKVVMGFGFYGRSFRLADPGCSTPGCKWDTIAEPGTCTGQHGFLSYFEISAILAANPGLRPVWDKEAAVKWLTFGDNQWVSYDDGDTFAQKVDFANSLGLGGAMIWAVDQDDDQYSAHTKFLGNFLGRSVVTHPNYQANAGRSTWAYLKAPAQVASVIDGVTGANCRVNSDKSGCVNINNPGPAYEVCGTDLMVGTVRITNRCKAGFENAICCPQDSAPSHCKWRGGAGDQGTKLCNGQCFTGEAAVLSDRNGGTLPAKEGNTNQCNTGQKSLCCQAPYWSNALSGCHGTGCDVVACGQNEESVFTTSGMCRLQNVQLPYCCSKPSALYDCVWRGSGKDCTDNICRSDEIQVDSSVYGNGGNVCPLTRRKAACCKVKKIDDIANVCSADYCSIAPEDCISDDDSDNENVGLTLQQRSLPWWEDGIEEDYSLLEERGADKRTITIILPSGRRIRIAIPDYPRAGVLLEQVPDIEAFAAHPVSSTDCSNAEVVWDPVSRSGPGPGYDTEHPMDHNIHAQFLISLTTGRLPSGALMPGGVSLPESYITDFWLAPNSVPGGIQGAHGNTFYSPFEAMADAFGSTNNPTNLRLCENSMNQIKGRITYGNSAIAVGRMERLLRRVGLGEESAANEILTRIEAVMATLRFTQTPRFTNPFDNIRADTNTMAERIAAADPVPGRSALMRQRWEAFVNDIYRTRGDSTRALMTTDLGLVRGEIMRSVAWRVAGGALSVTALRLLGAIDQQHDQMWRIYFGGFQPIYTLVVNSLFGYSVPGFDPVQ